MADFPIISDTSASLLKLLRDNMCPDPILSPESIMLASPSDKNSDFQLGLFMYDLRELSEYRITTPMHNENNFRTKPPKALALSYLLFINNKAQIAAGAEVEQRIFGRVIQTLTDYSSLILTTINPYLDSGEDSATISMINMSFEDKTKIWSALQNPYQMGIYFSVSPIMLSSRVEERVTRVTSIRTQTEIKQ